MKIEIMILVAVLSFVLLSGCTSFIEQGSDCLSKCGDVCKLIKSSNMSFDYSISLKKSVGGASMTCSCSCNLFG